MFWKFRRQAYMEDAKSKMDSHMQVQTVLEGMGEVRNSDLYRWMQSSNKCLDSLRYMMEWLGSPQYVLPLESPTGIVDLHEAVLLFASDLHAKGFAYRKSSRAVSSRA